MRGVSDELVERVREALGKRAFWLGRAEVRRVLEEAADGQLDDESVLERASCVRAARAFSRGLAVGVTVTVVALGVAYALVNW